MAIFRQELEQFRRDLACREDRQRVLVKDLVARIDKVKDLKLQVVILERAVVRGPQLQWKYAPKVRVPKPQHFKGTQNEKEIDNFP